MSHPSYEVDIATACWGAAGYITVSNVKFWEGIFTPVPRPLVQWHFDVIPQLRG